MGIEALLSTQIIDTTTVGRAVMTAADAAAARTAIGLGTLATQNGTITDYLTTAAAATTYQPLDGDLTALAALTGTNNIYYRSAANTWSSVTIGTGLTFTSGTLAASGGSGIGGSTGSTDNLILRADGTGGATLQNSDWSIPDVFTASPNATVNHLSLQATGSTTNVSVSIVPKGTGSFSLAVPDGTSTGGNARGASAVDLITVRTAAAQVVSGTRAFGVGARSTVSGTEAMCMASDSVVSGSNAVGMGVSVTSSNSSTIAIGNFVRAQNYAAVAIGISGLASGNQAIVLAHGNGSVASGDRGVAVGSGALANRNAMFAYATGGFSGAEGAGDAQFVRWVLRNKTTDGTTATTLFANGSSERCLLTSGKILHATVNILGSKSDGSVVASYMRQVTIKNVGGTTALVGTVNTLGTDEAASTSIAITADNTNDALQIAVTGIASETWRWVAIVEGVELAYGT
ncbi:MAG: hypothetical protein ACK528_06600 [Alphaproteobacteria bacterium]|jgi:hypothetical protein